MAFLFAAGSQGFSLPSGVALSSRRCSAPQMMGLFDGVKDAFGAGEKPAVGGDRVTPFDRWLGLDKELEAENTQGDPNAEMYVDPNDVNNYFAVSLAKPMGIAFVENANAPVVGECKGLVIDEVLPTGSAASSEKPLLPGDQLVAVDSTLVLGAEFDTGLEVRPHPGTASSAAQRLRSSGRPPHEPGPHARRPPDSICRARLQAIKASPGDSVKLTFFRGPLVFLYGPTKPSEDWYKENLC